MPFRRSRDRKFSENFQLANSPCWYYFEVQLTSLHLPPRKYNKNETNLKLIYSVCPQKRLPFVFEH